MIAIRPGRPDEAAALSALCFRSKAHWGYDEAFMALCRPTLEVQPQAIRAGEVLVAADDDRPVGVAQVAVSGTIADLALLFVEPAWIGRGVGKRLFQAAAAAARDRGCAWLEILADPNAAAFYAAMGAAAAGEAPSDAIPGRLLPLYRLALA